MRYLISRMAMLQTATFSLQLTTLWYSRRRFSSLLPTFPDSSGTSSTCIMYTLTIAILGSDMLMVC